MPGRTVVDFLQAVQSIAAPVAVQTDAPVGAYAEPPGLESISHHHIAYLLSRGFDPDEVAALWGVGGLRAVQRWHKLNLSWRLFIPVVLRQRRISWTTRAIKPAAELRYLAAPPACESVNIKTVVYGMDYVTHTAVIVEGSTDAWRIGRGACATLGTAVTDAQILRLAAVPRRVVLFDSSLAAQRRAQALADELACYPGDTLVATIAGDDPATAPQHEIDEIRQTFLL